MNNQITELAQRCFGPEALTYQFVDQLEDFAVGVSEMERQRIGKAYEKLSMIHSETMLELIETRKQLEHGTLWWGIKRRVKRALKAIA